MRAVDSDHRDGDDDAYDLLRHLLQRQSDQLQSSGRNYADVVVPEVLEVVVEEII